MAQQAVTIRPLHPDDLDDQHELMTHPAIVRQLLTLPIQKRSDTEKWIKQPQPGDHRLVAELNGKVVGQCTLTHYQRPRLQHLGRITHMVHPDYGQQDIDTKLLTAALDIADNWLDLKRIELELFTDNEPAVHLYQMFGFTIEGVRKKVAFGAGRWQDDLVMARLRQVADLQKNVSPPQRPLPPTPLTHPLYIRPSQPKDIDGLYTIFKHPAVARTTLQLPSQEIARTEQRIHQAPSGLYNYVAITNDTVIGNIVIHQKQQPRQFHSGELGMMVHPHYWGQGIGSRLMTVALDLADKWLNLKRVGLEVHMDNPAAIRLYEKFGFVIEGTKQYHTYGDGRWVDSHFMGRVKN